MGAKFTSLVTTDFPLHAALHDWSPNALTAARLRALQALHVQAQRRGIGAVGAAEGKEDDETDKDTTASGAARPGMLSLEEEVGIKDGEEKRRLASQRRGCPHFLAPCAADARPKRGRSGLSIAVPGEESKAAATPSRPSGLRRQGSKLRLQPLLASRTASPGSDGSDTGPVASLWKMQLDRSEFLDIFSDIDRRTEAGMLTLPLAVYDALAAPTTQQGSGASAGSAAEAEARAVPSVRLLHVLTLLALFGRGQLFQRITFLLETYRMAAEVEEDPDALLALRAAAIAADARIRERAGHKGPMPHVLSPRSQRRFQAQLAEGGSGLPPKVGGAPSPPPRRHGAAVAMERSLTVGTLSQLVQDVVHVCGAVGAVQAGDVQGAVDACSAMLLDSGRMYMAALTKDTRVLQLMTGEEAPVAGRSSAHSRPEQGMFKGGGADGRGASPSRSRRQPSPPARSGRPRAPPPSPAARPSSPMRLRGGQFRRSANLGTQLITVPLSGFFLFEPSSAALAAVKGVPAAQEAQAAFLQASVQPQVHPAGAAMATATAFTAVLPPGLWRPRPPSSSPLAQRNPHAATHKKALAARFGRANSGLPTLAGEVAAPEGGPLPPDLELELTERLSLGMAYALCIEPAQHAFISALQAESDRRLAEWKRRVGRGGGRRHRMSIMESLQLPSSNRRMRGGAHFHLPGANSPSPTGSGGDVAPGPSPAGGASARNSAVSAGSPANAEGGAGGIASPRGRLGLAVGPAPDPLVPKERFLAAMSSAHRLEKWQQHRVHLDTLRAWCLTHPIPRRLWEATGWPLQTPGKHQRAYVPDATLSWEVHSAASGEEEDPEQDKAEERRLEVLRRQDETDRALRSLVRQTQLSVSDVKAMQADFAAVSQDRMTVSKDQFGRLMMRTLARLARRRGIGVDRDAVESARDARLAAAAGSGGMALAVQAAGEEGAPDSAVSATSAAVQTAAARAGITAAATSKAAQTSLGHFLQRGREMSSRRVQTSAAKAAQAEEGGEEEGGVVSAAALSMAGERAHLAALREKWFGGVLDMLTIKRTRAASAAALSGAPPPSPSRARQSAAASPTREPGMGSVWQEVAAASPRAAGAAAAWDGADEEGDETLPASWHVAELGLDPDTSHPALWRLTERLFSAFDTSGDGEVDFGEFVLGVSRMCEGDFDAKLGLVFDMLDVDGSGEVSPLELILMVLGGRAAIRHARRNRRGSPLSLLSLMGAATHDERRRQNTGLREEGADGRQAFSQHFEEGGGGDGDGLPGLDMALIMFAKHLASAMDLNGDGRISRQEFQSVVTAEPILFECFSDALGLGRGSGTGPIFSFELLHTMLTHYSFDPTDVSSMPNHIRRKYRASRGGARSTPRAGSRAGELAGSTREDPVTGQVRLCMLDREVDLRFFRRLMVEQFGAPKHSQHLMSSVFRVFDGDNSGTVDIREVFLGLQRACRGDTESRANFFFDVFDRRNTGELELDQVYDMILATSSAGMEDDEEEEGGGGGSASPSSMQRQAREAVDLRGEAKRRLDELDTNGDGVVDRREFTSAVLADERQLSFFMRILGLGAATGGTAPAALRGGIVERRKALAATGGGGLPHEPPQPVLEEGGSDTDGGESDSADSAFDVGGGAGAPKLGAPGAPASTTAASIVAQWQATRERSASLVSSGGRSPSSRQPGKARPPSRGAARLGGRSSTVSLFSGSDDGGRSSPGGGGGSQAASKTSGGRTPSKAPGHIAPRQGHLANQLTRMFRSATKDERAILAELSEAGSSDGGAGRAGSPTPTPSERAPTTASASTTSSGGGEARPKRATVALRHLAQMTNMRRIASMVGVEQRLAEERAAEAQRQRRRHDRKAALQRRAAGPAGYYRQSSHTAASLMRGRRALLTVRSGKARLVGERRAAQKAEATSTAHAEAAANVLASVDTSLRKAAVAQRTRAALARTMALTARARTRGLGADDASDSGEDSDVSVSESVAWRHGAVATLNLSPRGGTGQLYGVTHRGKGGRDGHEPRAKAKTRPAFTTAGGHATTDAATSAVEGVKRALSRPGQRGGILADKTMLTTAMGASGVPVAVVSSAAQADLLRQHLSGGGNTRDVFGIGRALRRPGGIAADAHESNARRVDTGLGVSSPRRQGQRSEQVGADMAPSASAHALLPDAGSTAMARALSDPLLLANGGADGKRAVAAALRVRAPGTGRRLHGGGDGAASKARLAHLGPPATSARGMASSVGGTDGLSRTHAEVASSSGRIGLARVSAQARGEVLYSLDGHQIVTEGGEVVGGKHYQQYLRESTVRAEEVAQRAAQRRQSAAERATVHAALHVHAVDRQAKESGHGGSDGVPAVASSSASPHVPALDMTRIIARVDPPAPAKDFGGVVSTLDAVMPSSASGRVPRATGASGRSGAAASLASLPRRGGGRGASKRPGSGRPAVQPTPPPPAPTSPLRPAASAPGHLGTPARPARRARRAAAPPQPHKSGGTEDAVGQAAASVILGPMPPSTASLDTAGSGTDPHPSRTLSGAMESLSRLIAEGRGPGENPVPHPPRSARDAPGKPRKGKKGKRRRKGKAASGTQGLAAALIDSSGLASAGDIALLRQDTARDATLKRLRKAGIRLPLGGSSTSLARQAPPDASTARGRLSGAGTSQPGASGRASLPASARVRAAAANVLAASQSAASMRSTSSMPPTRSGGMLVPLLGSSTASLASTRWGGGSSSTLGASTALVPDRTTSRGGGRTPSQRNVESKGGPRRPGTGPLGSGVWHTVSHSTFGGDLRLGPDPGQAKLDSAETLAAADALLANMQ